MKLNLNKTFEIKKRYLAIVAQVEVVHVKTALAAKLIKCNIHFIRSLILLCFKIVKFLIYFFQVNGIPPIEL